MQVQAGKQRHARALQKLKRQELVDLGVDDPALDVDLAKLADTCMDNPDIAMPPMFEGTLDEIMIFPGQQIVPVSIQWRWQKQWPQRKRQQRRWSTSIVLSRRAG